MFLLHRWINKQPIFSTLKTMQCILCIVFRQFALHIAAVLIIDGGSQTIYLRHYVVEYRMITSTLFHIWIMENHVNLVVHIQILWLHISKVIISHSFFTLHLQQRDNICCFYRYNSVLFQEICQWLSWLQPELGHSDFTSMLIATAYCLVTTVAKLLTWW